MEIYCDGEKVSPDAITSFSGKYFFLSNLSRKYTPVNGIVYISAEAAFYAQFVNDKKDAYKFVNIEPGYAKALAEEIDTVIKTDSEQAEIMYNVVKAKFDNNPDIKYLLLDTGDADLYYGNIFGDKYWGVVKEGNELVGHNVLGRILMDLREEYRK